MNHETIQIFRWWASGRENSTQWLIGTLSGEIVLLPQTSWLINWFIISSFIRHMPLLVYYIRWKESLTLFVTCVPAQVWVHICIYFGTVLSPSKSSVQDLLADLLKTHIQMDCFFFYLMILHCQRRILSAVLTDAKNVILKLIHLPHLCVLGCPICQISLF